jgi:phospholipid-binding lipoprotein MlaA
MTRPLCALLIVATALTAGCATSNQAKGDPRDPFERVNRATFKFNDALDRAALKPVAKGYRKVTPHFVQTGVSNFMDNLDTPRTLVSDLLQGKFKASFNDTGRLLLNSTLGLGGLLDPATDAGLSKNDEDFGQVLGKWGIGSGPYIVLPLLGPSTMRDGIGRIPDHFTDPINYVERDSIRWGLWGVSVVDLRARYLDVEQTLNQTYDRYAFMRNVYLQRREYQVTDGNVPEDTADEDQMLQESEDH